MLSYCLYRLQPSNMERLFTLRQKKHTPSKNEKMRFRNKIITLSIEGVLGFVSLLLLTINFSKHTFPVKGVKSTNEVLFFFVLEQNLAKTSLKKLMKNFSHGGYNTSIIKILMPQKFSYVRVRVHCFCVNGPFRVITQTGNILRVRIATSSQVCPVVSVLVRNLRISCGVAVSTKRNEHGTIKPRRSLLANTLTSIKSACGKLKTALHKCTAKDQKCWS